MDVFAVLLGSVPGRPVPCRVVDGAGGGEGGEVGDEGVDCCGVGYRCPDSPWLLGGGGVVGAGGAGGGVQFAGGARWESMVGVAVSCE